jgi:biotin-dependent carboxylase-like uncharacterized protein
MALLIDEPGLQSTVQDLGRPGHYNVGIPLGGAMDTLAHAVANLLVGNDPAMATIEATYTGPSFTVTYPTTMAVTGACMDVTVNGQEVDQWTSVELREGDRVSCGYATRGSRGYLAFCGGINVPRVLGSRSTYAMGSLGGHHGRALEAGDTVPIGVCERRRSIVSLDPQLRPSFGTNVTARVVLGPYDHLLTPGSVELLAGTEWKLTPLADRTGLRLSGDERFEFVERGQPFGAGSDPSNIVDAGYAMGSIQIPGGGQPIVLHRDAVSAGGYATVATVISADMDILAQLTPGSTVRFHAVTIDQALLARADRANHRNDILHTLRSSKN